MSGARVRKLLVIGLVVALVAAVVRVLRGDPAPQFAGHPSVTPRPAPEPDAADAVQAVLAPVAERLADEPPEAVPTEAAVAVELEAAAEPTSAAPIESTPEPTVPAPVEAAAEPAPVRPAAEPTLFETEPIPAEAAPGPTVEAIAADGRTALHVVGDEGLADPAPAAPTAPSPLDPAPAAPAAPSPVPVDVAAAAWVVPVEGTCPEGFPIKAKLASGIFHRPGGLSYDRTRPDRCYATAEAAEADGLRAAKR